MKLKALIFFCAFLCVALKATATEPSAADLYESKQCFELRDQLRSKHNIAGADKIFFEAVVANRFHRPYRSLDLLKRYLSRADGNSRWIVDSYQILADNYLKTFQYQKAADAYGTILRKYGSKLDKDETEDYANSFQLWNSLRSVPPQTVASHGSTLLKGSVKSVPLTINGHELSLAIDSGAAISIIINSLAHEFGLQIIDATIKMGSITGATVNAKLGVARELKIGKVTLRNVVFLVFDDNDLLGPSEGEVKGVVGFPVISALREITVSTDGTITIPSHASKEGLGNLCLEGLKPLVFAFHNGKRLTFTFDTGAARSTFYPGFFSAFKEEIEAGGKQTSGEKLTGVGGSRNVAAYSFKDLTLMISGRQVRFNQVAILTEYTLSDSHHFYGNLGQDLIKHFSRMTLNFNAMSIIFE